MSDDSRSLPIVLLVHRSERADTLVGPLAAVLAEPLEDPFAPEVVAVPTQGVERWVAQRLSHVLGANAGEAGVCANVLFPSPAAVVSDAMGEALGEARGEDPWAVDRLTWAVLDVIDACRSEAWCVGVDRYLSPAADGSARDRRLGFARRLATRFNAYGTQRPDILTAWAAGQGVDGTGAMVPPELAWQPQLWRRVRKAVDAPSPAERLATAVKALRDSPSATRLPQRVSVLGATRNDRKPREIPFWSVSVIISVMTVLAAAIIIRHGVFTWWLGWPASGVALFVIAYAGDRIRSGVGAIHRKVKTTTASRDENPFPRHRGQLSGLRG